MLSTYHNTCYKTAFWLLNSGICLVIKFSSLIEDSKNIQNIYKNEVVKQSSSYSLYNESLTNTNKIIYLDKKSIKKQSAKKFLDLNSLSTLEKIINTNNSMLPKKYFINLTKEEKYLLLKNKIQNYEERKTLLNLFKKVLYYTLNRFMFIKKSIFDNGFPFDYNEKALHFTFYKKYELLLLNCDQSIIIIDNEYAGLEINCFLKQVNFINKKKFIKSLFDFNKKTIRFYMIGPNSKEIKPSTGFKILKETYKDLALYYKQILSDLNEPTLDNTLENA